MKVRTVIAFIGLTALAATADAALVGRDLDGSPGSFEAYYDTVLDITWLGNANLAATNTFGVAGISGTGRMTWDTANAWIAAMNGADYLGIDAWRLPQMYDINGDGCTVNSFTSYNGGDCGYNVVSTGAQASEMASLYFATLGNVAYYNTSGIANYGGAPHIQNTGPFQNLGNTLYWYGDETTTSSLGLDLGSPALNAWYFGMPSAGQRPQDKLDNSLTAWAVFDGDVAAVPVPGAVWLLGSAVAVLGALRRKTADLPVAPRNRLPSALT